MWPFKKKEKKVINSKYKVGDFVSFMYAKEFEKELTYGYIWKIKEDQEGNVIYDIQVGSQCPWFAENIKEEGVKPYTIRYKGYDSSKKEETK